MSYRFYQIVGRRIVRGENHQCADDAAACSKAAAMLLVTRQTSAETIEVWQGKRLVAGVTRDSLKAAS
jgi:hypothetical protein